MGHSDSYVLYRTMDSFIHRCRQHSDGPFCIKSRACGWLAKERMGGLSGWVGGEGPPDSHGVGLVSCNNILVVERLVGNFLIEVLAC